MAAEISLINVKVSSTLGTSRTHNTINDYWRLRKNWDLSVASRSIVCRSRRKKQIIAACKINFFQYYKIISAIPKQLLLKAGQLDSVDKQFFTSHYTVLITILESTWKKRNHETFTNCSLANSHWVQTGPKRWSDNLYLTHSLPEQFTKNGIFMTFWTF